MHNDGGKITLPRMTIDDEPYFDYCGAMLDIARKPHSIETLKRCVLAARMYKIRFIQLHMSDENAWTFPSTAYPKAGSTNFAWAGGDKPTVYNLDELKQLVAFADARGVTSFPNWKRPDTAAYPRGSLPEIFGYKDNSGKMVGKSVINIVSDRAISALDTIVGEMCDVFKSSPYFHVGCDESSLDIQDTPEFRSRIQRHHLPEPHLSVGIRLSSSKNGRTGEKARQADDRLGRSAVGPDRAAQGRDLHALGRRHWFRRRKSFAAGTRSSTRPGASKARTSIRSTWTGTRSLATISC